MSASALALNFQDLEGRQCIASTQKSARCLGKSPEGSLKSVERQLSKIPLTEPESVVSESTVRLLICNAHTEDALNAQLESLTSHYGPILLQHAKDHPFAQVVSFRPCKRNAKTTFAKKLESSIKENQFPTGVLYVFTWDGVPDMCKIGCAKSASDKRIKQWKRCYPGLKKCLEVSFVFPQRMEELIHLQLAENRYELNCDVQSCKSKVHDEWFKCLPDEVRLAINRWRDVIEHSSLYDSDKRQLTHNWDAALQSLLNSNSMQQTAAELLESMEGSAAALEHGMLGMSLDSAA